VRLSEFHQTVAVNADDPGASDNRLTVDVLVPVKKYLRFVLRYVPIECIEPRVDVVRFVVDSERGIMRTKNIHMREPGQHLLNIILLVEEVAGAFVFPAPG